MCSTVDCRFQKCVIIFGRDVRGEEDFKIRSKRIVRAVRQVIMQARDIQLLSFWV